MNTKHSQNITLFNESKVAKGKSVCLKRCYFARKRKV